MYNSQDRQDKYLEENVFRGFKNGYFVDVGAHNGVSINNTLFFEKEHNWTGINFEPIKSVYDQLIEARPNCINYNLAIDETDGETTFILNKGATEVISGIQIHYDSRHTNRLLHENGIYKSTTELIKVQTKRLETIFKENNIKNINYMSIDVEGAEFAVVKSINFDEVYIDVIDFENNYSDVSIPIVNYLITKGYYPLNYRGLDIMMIHKDSQFIRNEILFLP